MSGGPARASATELHAVAAESGPRVAVGPASWLVGRADWSDGAFTVFDQVIPPGLIVPIHRHENEAQISFVLAGTLGFWVDGEEFEMVAGGYVHRPAAKPHTLWNATAEPARMLELTTPGDDFERYAAELGALNETGRATPESVAALAAGYGIHFAEGPFDELCERHGVGPAGGFWK